MTDIKLTAAEIKLLVKLLESKIERFESEDLIHMLRGPKYHYVLDDIYDRVFRPLIKYDVSVLDEAKQASEKESQIVRAVWDRLRTYLSERLDD